MARQFSKDKSIWRYKWDVGEILEELNTSRPQWMTQKLESVEKTSIMIQTERKTQQL